MASAELQNHPIKMMIFNGYSLYMTSFLYNIGLQKFWKHYPTELESPNRPKEADTKSSLQIVFNSFL